MQGVHDDFTITNISNVKFIFDSLISDLDFPFEKTLWRFSYDVP